MTKSVHTEIEIDAAPARVWVVLTDFAKYPRWNPFIRNVHGAPARGARLDVFVQPEGGRALRFRPVVVAAEAERELRWRETLLFGVLFAAERRFRIEPRGANRVRFAHGEDFGGLLAPLMARRFDEAARRGFEAMNAALKAEAEKVEPPSWRELVARGEIEAAEALLRAGGDGGDAAFGLAEFYEHLGDRAAAGGERRTLYAESLRLFQIYAAASTSGGEGTARMRDVARLRQKIGEL